MEQQTPTEAEEPTVIEKLDSQIIAEKEVQPSTNESKSNAPHDASKFRYEGSVVRKNVKCNMVLTKESIAWTKSEKKTTTLPLASVIGAKIHDTNAYAFKLYIYHSAKEGKPKGKSEETFICQSNQNAIEWVNAIHSVLNGVPVGETPQKRTLIIFVNPAGGSGKSPEIWGKVKYMFDAANIDTNVILTERQGHASEVVQNMDTAKCQGIVTISGDGLVYEVLNGLMNRKDWDTARKIPLGIIPGGSGNGMAANLKASKPSDAAFYIVKGRTSPVDVWSVIQGEKRYYAILSVTWSLVADIDVESEKFRWMGGFRFTWTAVHKLLAKLTPSKGKVSYLPYEFSTKEVCNPKDCRVCTSDLHDHELTDNGPVTNLLKQDSDKWVTTEGEFTYFVATNVRQLSGDFNAAPYAHLADGYIDLVFAKSLSKTKLTKVLLELETGKFVHMPGMEYHKVKAFKLEPTESKVIMIDGERLPPEPIQVEVHSAFARLFVEP